jgi:hypothetical protein
MKISQPMLCVLLAVMGVGPLTGCSIFAGGDDQEMEEVVADEDELAPPDETVEVDTEDNDDTTEMADSSDTMDDSPTDTADDISAMGDSLLNDIGSASDSADTTAGDGAMAGGMNTAPTTAAGTEVVTDNDSTSPTPANTIPNDLTGIDPTFAADSDNGATNNQQAMPTSGANAQTATPPAGAKVFYAKTNSQLKDGPDGANQGDRLKQGDPVLAKIEGDWAHVVDRGWLKTSDLSETPVARQKPQKGWQASSP